MLYCYLLSISYRLEFILIEALLVYSPSFSPPSNAVNLAAVLLLPHAFSLWERELVSHTILLFDRPRIFSPHVSSRLWLQSQPITVRGCRANRTTNYSAMAGLPTNDLLSFPLCTILIDYCSRYCLLSCKFPSLVTLLKAYDCCPANLQYSSIVIVQTHLISGQPHQIDECIRLDPSIFLIFTFSLSQRSSVVFRQTAFAFSFSFIHLSTFPRFILHLTSHPSSSHPSAAYRKYCTSTFPHLSFDIYSFTTEN